LGIKNTNCLVFCIQHFFIFDKIWIPHQTQRCLSLQKYEVQYTLIDTKARGREIQEHIFKEKNSIKFKEGWMNSRMDVEGRKKERKKDIFRYLHNSTFSLAFALVVSSIQV
jgi:hypothetical protein